MLKSIIGKFWSIIDSSLAGKFETKVAEFGQHVYHVNTSTVTVV